jgi:hypothetical protein
MLTISIITTFLFLSFQVIQERKALHAKSQKESEATAGAEEVTPGWLFILLFEDALLL